MAFIREDEHFAGDARFPCRIIRAYALVDGHEMIEGLMRSACWAACRAGVSSKPISGGCSIASSSQSWQAALCFT